MVKYLLLLRCIKLNKIYWVLYIWYMFCGKKKQNIIQKWITLLRINWYEIYPKLDLTPSFSFLKTKLLIKIIFFILFLYSFASVYSYMFLCIFRVSDLNFFFLFITNLRLILCENRIFAAICQLRFQVHFLVYLIIKNEKNILFIFRHER